MLVRVPQIIESKWEPEPPENRRERIATAVLAGICANPAMGSMNTHFKLASWALDQADELIAVLDKGEKT